MGAIRETATPRTTVETFLSRARSLGERPFLHFHQDGAWRCLSWAEARQRVLRVAAALVAEGVRPGDRVVLISENRFEWILADFGIQAAGAVTVPIYPSLLQATVRSMVEDSGAVVGLAGTEELGGKLLGPPAMRRVVTFDPGLHRWFQREPPAAEVEELERRAARLGPDDLATIVYTSGTTGESKGVLLAHRNLVDMAASDLRAFRIGPDDVLLSALPYAHVLERVSAVFNVVTAGAQLWVSRGLDHLAGDLTEVRPTIMIGVPRLFEKVHDRVLQQAASGPGLRRALFAWALRAGRRHVQARRPGPATRLGRALADRLVLAGVRRRLTGGRLRFFVTGGAPLSEEVEEFFWALGIPVLQGWGMTELTSAATSNTETEHRFGTVGRPLPGVELRIAADGEILVRGPGVMLGYHRRARLTAAALEDGWLHTGDVGLLDGGHLRITDRKKDLLKTAGGKYVAPLPLESRLQEAREIEWALLVGDERPFVTALVVPDWGALRDEHGIDGDPDALAADVRVRSIVQERVDALNRNLAGFETVRAFAVLSRPFSEGDGELTPTLKPKRRVIVRRYREVIDAMYESATLAYRGG
ncbi:MAG: long-chain fatty acid--CoA ligase [Chloroflexi bacterium]|nr:MAG: long-chain fatty acid--CoA ligase [Chloroflexota bacterium]